jgi:hypothetical protein
MIVKQHQPLNILRREIRARQLSDIHIWTHVSCRLEGYTTELAIRHSNKMGK